MATSEPHEEGQLEWLIEHIADEKDPPWDEVATPEGESAAIRSLQTIARVAAAYRAKWPEEGQETAPSGPSKQPPDDDGERSLGQWNHLELLEYLGGGAFGDLYRARNQRIDQVVALKLLTREESESKRATKWIDEARNQAKVKHRGVAQVHDAVRYDGRIGIWMELVPGKNLQQMLEEQGTLGSGEIRRIGEELCLAIAAVHGAGVLHRDIKPRNVMREEGTGRIVLTDFGTSTLKSRDPDPDEPVKGTPLYMAPELFEDSPPTARSDIYSLGVTLFHLATGEYPVEGEDIAGLRSAHREGRRRLLSDLRPNLDPRLADAIEKAIAPKPENRYQTAGEFRRALAPGISIPIPALAAAATLVVLAAIVIWPHVGPYRVDATLLRAGSAGIEVLLPGAMISPGDQLMLELKSSRAVHVYVISYDDRGEQYLLFPMGQSDLVNPLPTGGPHRLPGTRAASQLTWTVTSSGGREHIVVVVSPKRLEKLEGLIDEIKRPGFAPITTEQVQRFRGIGGIGEHEASSGTLPPSQIFKNVGTLNNKSESTRGAWVRQIDLVYGQ